MVKPSSADIAAMRTNIPTHIQQAMNQQLQQNLPANLRQYVGDNHGFVPPQAQRQIANAMQRMPGHLRQYSDAYMQQRVMQASFAPPRTAPAPHAPTPDHLRLGHSMPTGEQFNVAWAETAAQQAQQPAANNYSPAAPPTPPPYDPTVSHQPDYSFIMEPAHPPKPPLFSGSVIGRVAMVLGGLLALLIIVVVAKNVFGGTQSNVTDFVGLAQDQAAMVHILSAAQEQAGLSTSSQNFIVTADLSLSNSKTETLTYLSQNHKHLKDKDLSLKVSSSLDKQLTDASSGGTYEQTLHDIMSQQLKNYSAALQHAYTDNKGPKGRALLRTEYTRTQLLLKQLDTPAT